LQCIIINEYDEAMRRVKLYLYNLCISNRRTRHNDFR